MAAAADPFPIQRATIRHGPSFQTEPFDIDVLCAKLEVARLEQDAERARQRLRQLTAGGREETSTATLQHQSPPRADRQPSTHSIEKLKKRPPPEARQSVHAKQVFTTVSVAGSKPEEPTDSAIASAQRTANGPSRYSTRSSTGAADAHGVVPRDVPKRKSVMFGSDTNSTSTTTTQRQSVIERPGSRDMANRRSKTFPVEGMKLPLKHRSMSESEYVESKKPKAVVEESPESPMGLVNEYTISFDLGDIPRDSYSRASDYVKPKKEKPQPGERLRSRSLLSLPLLFKKERAQVTTEEVDLSPPHETPSSPPVWNADNASHVRQASLPIDMNINTTAARPRLAGRESKRRSFVGWLKNL